MYHSLRRVLGNALDLVDSLDHFYHLGFATPWDIPGQRSKKDSLLDILKKRLAIEQINTGEFEEMEEY